MNKLIVPAVVVILLVAVYVIYQSGSEEVAAPVAMQVELPPQQEAPQEQVPPPVQFPVPEPQVQAEPVIPLPALDESDPSVVEEFNGLVDEAQFADLFLFQAFIRNFVVIVDNLTADKLPQKYLFFRPAAGVFMVKKPVSETDSIQLDPQNYARYAAFVRLAESIDLDSMVNVYVYLYPLFQQAYAEMGYPDRYFNDRLIEVITHLLTTPEIQDPIVLVQPKVYYQFADPKLEALSAGQKMLIRIGTENSRIIKIKLQELLGKLKRLNQ